VALLVNGEYIEEVAIRQERDLIRRRLREQTPEETGLAIETKALEWAQDNVIERVLLRQAALRYTASEPSPDQSAVTGETGCATAPSHQSLIAHQSLTEGAPTDWRLAKLLESVTRDVPRPQTREVSDFYRKNQALFFRPECAHASHIVKNVDEGTTEAEARAAIETVAAELRKGRLFAELAEEYSDCPGGGGELGWFARGQMVEEFDAVVFALRPGDVSGIFQSPFGFHLAKLHQRRLAGILPLPEVYNRVEEMIVNRRREEVAACFLDELRAKAEIRRVPSAKVEPTT